MNRRNRAGVTVAARGAWLAGLAVCAQASYALASGPDTHIFVPVGLKSQNIAGKPLPMPRPTGFFPYPIPTPQAADARYSLCHVVANDDVGSDGRTDRIEITDYGLSGRVIRTSADEDADGHANSNVWWSYGGGERITTTKLDRDGNFTVDATARYSYAENSRLSAEERHYGFDAVTDWRQHYEYNNDGMLVAAFLDNDNNGVIDWSRSYEYDTQRRLIRTATDQRNDGSIDIAEVFLWSGDLVVRSEWYLDGVLWAYHLQSYDNRGRLVEVRSYDVLDDNEPFAVLRHAYNDDDQEVSVILYSYGDLTSAYWTTYDSSGRRSRVDYFVSPDSGSIAYATLCATGIVEHRPSSAD